MISSSIRHDMDSLTHDAVNALQCRFRMRGYHESPREQIVDKCQLQKYSSEGLGSELTLAADTYEIGHVSALSDGQNVGLVALNQAAPIAQRRKHPAR